MLSFPFTSTILVPLGLLHFPFKYYTKEFLKEQLAIIFCTSGISFKETLIKQYTRNTPAPD
jgi:hypothetical protein